MEAVPLILPVVIAAALASLVVPFFRHMVRWISDRISRFAPILDEFEIVYSGVLPFGFQIARRKRQLPLDEKIEMLIESLREATAVIDAIQSEIDTKRQQAEDFRQRAELYRDLASVNEDQAEALLAQMRELTDDSSAGSNRWTTLMAIVTLLISLIVTAGIGFLFYRLGVNAGSSG